MLKTHSKILSFKEASNKEASNKFFYEFANPRLAKEMAEIYSDAVQERCDRFRLYHDGNFLILDGNAMIEFLKQTNQESQIESMKNVLTEFALELKNEIDSSQSTPCFKTGKTATANMVKNSLNTVGNNVDEKRDRLMSADEAKLNLTLALLYLSRISNNPDSSHYWDMTSYRTSDSFEPDAIDWLEEVGFVASDNNPTHSKQLIITKAGVFRAREILAQLGVQDWNKAEILKDNIKNKE